MIGIEVGAAPRAVLVVAAYFQVTGGGHGIQPFSRQPPESGWPDPPALVSSGPRVLEL